MLALILKDLWGVSQGPVNCGAQVTECSKLIEKECSHGSGKTSQDGAGR